MKNLCQITQKWILPWKLTLDTKVDIGVDLARQKMLAIRQRDGAAARPPVAGWIDPDWLEERCEDCECGLCFGVMVEPVSGCLEGHTYCRSCVVKELRERKRCPACRHPVQEGKLTRIRPLEGIIAKLKLRRCEHGAGDEAEAPPAAKRAKVAPAASMAVEALKKELRQRGLETAGDKPTLVARLEEDRRKGAPRAGCGWRGRVVELAAHLGACEWAPVKCPHGCAESPLRRDLAEHDATCGSLKVPCKGCTQQFQRRLLAEHEGSCPLAEIECPNEGCSVKHARGSMHVHRAKCEHGEVSCPCPGCDARLLRKDTDAHLAEHLGRGAEPAAVQLLKDAYRRIAVVEAAAESEQRHAAASPTSWVFNWRADQPWPSPGFGPQGLVKSESHDFGGGVAGACIIFNMFGGYHISIRLSGVTMGKCRVHATFSILDKHDKTLCQVGEFGTANRPQEAATCSLGKYKVFAGKFFKVTAVEKAQSLRADGSIRLRAVVRLFLD